MKKICLALIATMLVMMSGCGWTKKTLGFAKTGPDETLVQTNRPLILPPEYDARPNKVLVKSQEDDKSDLEEDDIAADENE